jgi:predicted amidohydrolase YtcJ
VRGVGYIESVAGPLNRRLLDRLVADRPVRVQHRSGALWVLNTVALRTTGLDHSSDPDVERDAAGDVTGRLWRFDAKLRDLIGPVDLARHLTALVAQLHGYGITGVTDATPDLDVAAVATLTSLPLDVLLLGVPDDAQLPTHATVGPHKLLLRDHDLPHVDELTGRIAQTHARGRAVAVHCVTRESLILTVLALEQVGVLAGDRVEHAAVVPHDLTHRLAALGVAVVTQPSFITRRGDDYLRDVEPDDIDCLYRYASLLAAGLPVAPSSDAPYGELDPWRAMTAAHDRRTTSGDCIGPAERVETATVLGGFLSPASQPGGRPRRLAPGAIADLCLLDAPLDEVLLQPSAERVRLVLRRGLPVSGR